jgi:release factor glutamine methyltransferase
MRSAPASPSRPRAELVRGAGIDQLDAELLLAHVLATDRAALHREPELIVPADAASAFAALAARRRAGEPVAYLIGRRGFRRLELAVDPRVLIPRPETEHLVEAALVLPEGARVVDVGTGSGAVALALADERPDLEVLGVDVSEDALVVARANAGRLGLDVAFASSNLLAGVTGRVDAVVANLPYVPDGEPLMADVAGYEPALALRGGPDGLDVVRELVVEAALRGAPFLALEVGAGQAPAVAALLGQCGWAHVGRVLDLAGIERVVTGCS